MREVATVVALLWPLIGAALAVRARGPAEARRIGTLSMVLALGCAAAALALDAHGGAPPHLSGDAAGGSALLPVAVAAIGLTAVALSPLAGVTRWTFARVLLTNAASLALIVTRHPIGLAALFGVSMLPAWLELRARPETRPGARALAAYMVPSAALVATGSGLLVAGLPMAAVLPLALGIAIREAMVPFHSWFPSFVERAPLSIVVAAVAPQLGVYAHLSWLSGRLPPELEYAVAALGAVTVVFAAAMGAVQRRVRRSLGYLMMSQTALVAFGLETGSAVGRAGALASWVVCGLATAGLAMTTAALEARRGKLSLDRPGGSLRRLPLLSSAYLLLGLASVGLPGTLGFVAEDLLVQGSVQRFPFLGLTLIVGTALNSVTVVRTFFALFTGTRARVGERDLSARERAVLTLVLGALVAAGLAPRAPLRWLRATDPTHQEIRP